MKSLAKLKILIATVPADGHFNPLTGIAKYLQEQGHDVRWYSGPGYAERAARLGIPFYAYQEARNINQDNIADMFPERQAIKGTMARIRFDIRHAFLANVPAYYKDIRLISEDFDFNVLLCDQGFMAAQLIQEKLQKPAIVVGIAPLTESSRDLPPYSLGLTPGRGVLGRMRDYLLRKIFPRLVFGDATRHYNQIMIEHGLPPVKDSFLNISIRYTTRFLQSGVPGFEYPRSDMHPNVRFTGPLLPYKKAAAKPFAYSDLARQYQKIVLISQGTVDNKEPQKLIIPTLEAFKRQPYLLLVATGGMHTADLRTRYPQSNIVIEDFIDYESVLPYTDLFVSSGGYGSVLLSLNYGVPVLAAGKHEGKNEIVARVGYFGLGVNLGTETPLPRQVAQGAWKIWSNPAYRQKVAELRREFARYQPNQQSEQYIREAVATFQSPTKPVHSLA
ncbi:MAG TPA: nucleotide disphospho-sugar-binding domain-containing protein [Flavisolibacter sp.]|nr:nucleotide disphospho-sugar-binding domain-containing protein [Flavisolibacter sp.]